MENIDININYFVEDLYDQMMASKTQIEDGYKSGSEVSMLYSKPNFGIFIEKSYNEETDLIYTMGLFIEDSLKSYYARIFKVQSINRPFTKEEIRDYIDRMNCTLLVS